MEYIACIIMYYMMNTIMQKGVRKIGDAETDLGNRVKIQFRESICVELDQLA